MHARPCDFSWGELSMVLNVEQVWGSERKSENSSDERQYFSRYDFLVLRESEGKTG